jgi:hypothetical protein
MPRSGYRENISIKLTTRERDEMVSVLRDGELPGQFGRAALLKEISARQAAQAIDPTE